MVDTFSLRVQQPVDKELANALYNPKYKYCVKANLELISLVLSLCHFSKLHHTTNIHNLTPLTSQLICSVYSPLFYTGCIVLCTGLHLGLCYDGHIWARTGGRKILSWEWWLGDGAYVAEPQVLSPCCKPKGRRLTARELELNAIISHYRARVKHVNHLMESHAILKNVFRGGLSLLIDAFFCNCTPPISTYTNTSVIPHTATGHTFKEQPGRNE
jgi:DDE superfamily endonuclease